MGNAARRRGYYEEKDSFKEGHMALVWNELEERLNGKRNLTWSLRSNHTMWRSWYFFGKFLFENFNGTLNHILCRYHILTLQTV